MQRCLVEFAAFSVTYVIFDVAMCRLTYLLLFTLLMSCVGKEEGTTPQYMPITESVYASVSIQPEGMYAVYAAVPGILDSLYVAEGDVVRAGQLLAKLVTESTELLRENAQLQMDLAEDKLKGRANALATLEQEIVIARDQFRLDSLNYIRQKNLWDQQIGAQVEFENRKLRYEQAAANLQLLKQRYAQTRTELVNSYARSKNNLEQAETRLQEHLVTARIDGKVYALRKEEGEFVLNQEVIAELGSADRFLIEMAIDEVDVARVRLGQPVMVVLDAYGDQVFEAAVNKIYPKKDDRSQTFKVEAQFRELPEVLYAGLSGEANILIQSKEKALVIPLSYLGPGNTVRTDTAMISVQTGLRNMEQVEILSGLDSATLILKP